MKLPIFRLPKLLLLSICGSVLFVCFCYVASQWYYSRWDVTSSAFRSLEYVKGKGGLFTIEEIQSALSQDSYIGADDPKSRSPELVENINAFEDWLFKHPFVQYDEYSPKVLEKQLAAAEGDEKSELAWQIINQFDHAHDFMIDLMNLYADQRLPFERESEEYQFITETINSYCHMLDKVADPFGVETFRKLHEDIETDQRKRENDAEWQRKRQEADNARQTLAELQKMLGEYDKSREVKVGQQTVSGPWTMSSPSDANVSDGIDSSLFNENLKELSPPEVFSTDETLPVPKATDDPLEIDEGFTDESHSTPTGEPLSPDRFDKAQQLIDQYGTEEGLRRLRESDPDAARQFERERRSPPTVMCQVRLNPSTIASIKKRSM